MHGSYTRCKRAHNVISEIEQHKKKPDLLGEDESEHDVDVEDEADEGQGGDQEGEQKVGHFGQLHEPRLSLARRCRHGGKREREGGEPLLSHHDIMAVLSGVSNIRPVRF